MIFTVLLCRGGTGSRRCRCRTPQNVAVGTLAYTSHIHIHTHTHSHTPAHTHTQTNTHTNTQTHTHTHTRARAHTHARKKQVASETTPVWEISVRRHVCCNRRCLQAPKRTYTYEHTHTALLHTHAHTRISYAPKQIIHKFNHKHRTHILRHCLWWLGVRVRTCVCVCVYDREDYVMY